MAVSQQSRMRALKLALGVGLSAALLYAMFAQAPLAAVGRALASAAPEWIAMAVLAVAVAYALKVLRWLVMLRGLGAHAGVHEASIGLLGSVALNNVLPFRAGDVIRVLAFEKITGLPPSQQAGTLILERLLDLLSLCLIVFVTMTLADITLSDPRIGWALQLGSLAAIAAIVVLVVAPRPLQSLTHWGVARVPALRRVGEIAVRLLGAIHTLTRWRLLLKAGVLSVCAWTCEGLAFVAVGRSLGLTHAAAGDWLAMGAGTLSTMIPSAPGYVGTFHYFTALVVSAFGAERGAAAAYAILIHGILWLATTSAGFLLLASSPLRTAKSAVAKG